MRILFWNCQGLGNPLTIQQLQALCKQHSPDMIILVETKNQVNKIISLKKRLRFQSHFAIDPIGLSGGMSILWNHDLELSIQQYDSFYIVTSLVDHTSFSFDVVSCYLSTKQSTRDGQLQALQLLRSKLQGDFIFVGDFNDILCQCDKQGGLPYDPIHHVIFHDFVNAMNMVDLEDIGSDHCPLLHNTNSHLPKPKAQFHFDKQWVQIQAITTIVESTWSQSIEGSRMYQIFQKLKLCRHKIVEWNMQHRVNANIKIKTLTAAIQQAKMVSNMHINWPYVKNLEYNLYKARQEEYYWRQKSRQTWLQQEDKNTRFFHATTLQRRRRNTISGIFDTSNYWHTDPLEINNVILNHFKQQFTSAQPHQNPEVFNQLPNALSFQMNTSLCRPITDADIENAIFTINPNKAPEYRPISLCSVYYKIISKILTARLQHITPLIISQQQNAFTKGRSIANNILLAHEIIHYLKTKNQGNSYYMAVKLHSHTLLGLMEQAMDSFFPSRGIRQGDPLSPLLYILCSEGLTHIIRSAVASKMILLYSLKQPFKILQLYNNCLTSMEYSSIKKSHFFRYYLNDISETSYLEEPFSIFRGQRNLNQSSRISDSYICIDEFQAAKIPLSSYLAANSLLLVGSTTR
ncbi:uncharacterized protein LOC126672595 [Mercurialis annua]|uniref:uncharacterized protein LOC126672595 n=1 Tax=Mercurialis annua TaxID=3986 RepID=UPI0021608B55|nr:uncharacterized protein LOC126672595 [Mercurialis annua]